MKITNLVILAITFTLIAAGLALKSNTQGSGCINLYGDAKNKIGKTCNDETSLATNKGPLQFNKRFLGISYDSKWDSTEIALFPKDDCVGNNFIKISPPKDNYGSPFKIDVPKYKGTKQYSRSVAWLINPSKPRARTPIHLSKCVNFHEDVCLIRKNDKQLCGSLRKADKFTWRRFMDLSKVKSISFIGIAKVYFFTEANYKGSKFVITGNVFNVKDNPELEEFLKTKKINSIAVFWDKTK
jgi:hypothetical protein